MCWRYASRCWNSERIRERTKVHVKLKLNQKKKKRIQKLSSGSQSLSLSFSWWMTITNAFSPISTTSLCSTILRFDSEFFSFYRIHHSKIKQTKKRKKQSVGLERVMQPNFKRPERELGKWRMRRCIVATTDKITERQTDTILINGHCTLVPPPKCHSNRIFLGCCAGSCCWVNRITWRQWHFTKGANFSFSQNTGILRFT